MSFFFRYFQTINESLLHRSCIPNPSPPGKGNRIEKAALALPLGNSSVLSRAERHIGRSAAWQLQPSVDKNKTTHRLCHSEHSETESRNLPKWQILPCVGTFLSRSGFLHSANATVGMTMRGRFYGFAYCFLNVSGRPAASSVRAAPCQLPRRGSFCTGLWGAGVSVTVPSFYVRNGT